MTDLLLIRHGEATHNVDGRLEGWGDTELTVRGLRQAEAVAQRLSGWASPIRQVYTSPLRRARQTAEPISVCLGQKPIMHDGLREINFGEVNGHTLESFQASMPRTYAHWGNRTDMSFQFPGGEQRRSFARRVSCTLDEIIARHGGETVVIVAHGGTLRAGLAHLLPDTMADWWAYTLSNASLSHVRARHDRMSLVTLDDWSHLQGGESPK